MELPRDPDLAALPEGVDEGTKLTVTTMTENGVQSAYFDSELLAHAIADQRRGREHQ